MTVGTGALRDVTLITVACDGCDADRLQQSAGVPCRPQVWCPFLQQAICCASELMAPSTHVAHVDPQRATRARVAKTCRRQERIPTIVRRARMAVNQPPPTDGDREQRRTGFGEGQPNDPALEQRHGDRARVEGRALSDQSRCPLAAPCRRIDENSREDCNKSRAASRLGITRTQLYIRLRKCGLQPRAS